MTGRLRDLTMNRDGTQNITVTISGDFREQFDSLRDRLLDVDLKAHRQKRSLDANGYMWVLVDKIAQAMKADKLEIYREAIRHIGGVSEPICVRNRAVDAIRESWQARGLGWITDTQPSKVKDCTTVILYYGSSTYDTRQMSLLIDHLVQDAKALGIETDTPEKLRQLQAEWEEYEARHRRRNGRGEAMKDA